MKPNPKQPQVPITPASSHNEGFMSGLAIGAALGAAALYLFGTEKGKKLKDELLVMGKEYLSELEQEVEAVKKIHEKGNEVAARAESTYKTALEEKQEIIERMEEKKEQILDQIAETKEAIAQYVPAIQSKVEQAIEQVQEVKAEIIEEFPEIQEEVAEELSNLQIEVKEAKQKAEAMQKDLHKAASNIERKFFVRKGKKLGK